VGGTGSKMKKTIELYVDLSSVNLLPGISINVTLDTDSMGIVVGNEGSVLDAAHYEYQELGIEVKESPNKESNTKG
jgi:predicted RNA-binding protein Jag